MAKRQTDTNVTLVEALVPMWGADVVVPVGTVYSLPAAAADDLAGRGMVRIIGGDAEVIEADAPAEVVEAAEVVAFDLATEGEFS